MGEVHYQNQETPPASVRPAQALDLLLAKGGAGGPAPCAAREAPAGGRRWAEGGALALNITAPAERSNSVTTV